MYYGDGEFICSECKGTFVGPMIEWQCTCLRQPLKCPHCGSMHTRPMESWECPEWTDEDMNALYKNLWERFDKGTQGGNVCIIPLSAFESQSEQDEETKETLWKKISDTIGTPFLVIWLLFVTLNDLLPLWLKIFLAVVLLGIIALLIF